ncbi:nitroreductase family deazaflavin-dependent oxidoreductase [Microbacterium sp. 18062]|uniref:nitroreductase family deazaflavin-dependent oxidoreductase n=1 Tax=Microbacterium sp. 18062 TaxID=2681410 RepID=UPI00135804E3|nr:nitroreductase family deazaflavin-dependent oxidoreductase [Microbacterium sp. 18062]
MTSPYARFNDPIIAEFRANGGTVSQFGRSLVLLHHVGARSGAERVTPVMAIPDGPGTWLIAASKAGADDNPGWFHNLLAHPDTEIETPDGVVPVHAAVLRDDARDAAWARFTAASPGFQQYEQRTTRIIPVVELTRRD